MGQLHLKFQTLREVALHGATANEGVLLAIDPVASTVRVRVERTYSRELPARKGSLRRAWERLAPPGPGGPVEREFAVEPPPVATDAFSHPLFLRVAGEVPLHALAPGERVVAISGPRAAAVLRDEPATRADLEAAFHREGDLRWAAEAGDAALHDSLLDRERWDAALDELRWRGTLDLPSLAARMPVARLPDLVGLATDPRVRATLIAHAAAALARSDDAPAFVALVRGLLDRVRFHELVPLLLLADPARSEHADPVSIARIRLAMVLRDEPHRAAEFAALAARVGA